MSQPARAEQPAPEAQPHRAAQTQWAAQTIQFRLQILRRARHILAQRAKDLAESVPNLPRTHADTLAAEVLPLLAAIRFLERSAPKLLAPRRLGRRGLPFWLSGLYSTVERVPYGKVLVVGPANYPLFLPGVQTMQALVAGNAVVWKPGTGGRAVALLVAEILQQSGLPKDLLRVAGESPEDGARELRNVPDKIVFTGSANTGRAILHAAADLAIPVVAELSGADAVIVLPSADPKLVVDALAFGLRFNGSATCMAPRRLILLGHGHEILLDTLITRLRTIPGVLIREPQRTHFRTLADEAVQAGATIVGDVRAPLMKPILIMNGHPEMRIAQSDLFAPDLTVLHCKTQDDVLAADAGCPYGLTAAIFGDEKEALTLGRHLNVGTVLINDLIVPTVDPRVPFTGRRASGFGATRGAEGLLEMTAPRTLLVRRRNDRRHFQSTTEAHEELFQGIVQSGHAPTLRTRLAGLRRVIEAAKHFTKEKS